MNVRRVLVVVVAATVIVGGCGDSDHAIDTFEGSRLVVEGTPTGAEADTTTEPTSSGAPAAPSTAATESTDTEPAFASRIVEIDDEIATRMTYSWREGCPVSLVDLRLVELSYWGYDGLPHDGELVIHADWADDIVEVFRQLFDAQFPIQQMVLVDEFEGSDPASMAANNTSAFNCREVAYRPGVWSNHAFGTAIDVNPLVNPYVDGDFVDPPEGELFVDRSAGVPGGIYADDVVVRAFESIGWGWGGSWSGAVDYQHFSATGR